MALPASPPLFQQVAQVLRQRLQDGTYPPGIPLPGERELTREFGVARTTIRSALARLQEEGCVTRLRGQGTLPVPQPSTQEHSKIRNGLLENILRFGQRTRIALVSVQFVAAVPAVARALQVSPGSRVMQVVRVRKSRQTPLLCTEAYLPPHVAAAIDLCALQDMPLLEAIERAGHSFAQGEQELIAVQATPEVAALLQIEPGAPLLRVSRVVSNAQGVPLQYLLGHYAPERYQYRMRLSRTGGATQVWITD
ncbi:GntR family transcriptional regulator [Oryzisolibacter propanilivorax]|uniref:GntR family transcriptional regulator n=1 Tax=Oryzisolibacter propanilivorax TaxID=1527607 RepID=A0A1G9RE07_9BURK|nr:GntR family transcriptional regulator [Oryzisolibacter propanilivorax]SDM21454.1 GntR family transcriptional regulator [Oryzisolibacter propanilivorax]